MESYFCTHNLVNDHMDSQSTKHLTMRATASGNNRYTYFHIPSKKFWIPFLSVIALLLIISVALGLHFWLSSENKNAESDSSDSSSLTQEINANVTSIINSSDSPDNDTDADASTDIENNGIIISTNTKDCNLQCRLGQDIVSIMNLDVDKCTHFYEFSNGKWSNYYHVSLDTIDPALLNLDVFEAMTLHSERLIANLFENGTLLCKTCSAEQKARNFYTSCKVMGANDFSMSVETDKAKKTKEECIQETIRNFPDVLSRLYIMATQPSRAKREDVHKIFSLTKEAFKFFISEVPWSNSTAKNEFLSTLDTLKLVAGYPDNIMEENVLDERYRLVEINYNTYHKNLRNLEPYLNHTDRLAKEDNVFISHAYFDPSDETVVVHEGMLQYPVYDINFPSVVKFSRLGFIFAHEITHSLLMSYPMMLNDLTTCIEKYYIDGRATLHENIADVIGVHVANLAMSNFAGLDYNKKIPGLEHYTTKKIFYITWAQMMASPDGSKRIKDSYSSNIDRVDGSLYHSNDFRKVFDCANTVQCKHSNRKKCEIS